MIRLGCVSRTRGATLNAQVSSMDEQSTRLPPLPTTQFLLDLRDTGTRMDSDAVWADWTERPGQDPKPVFPESDSRKTKTEFNTEEELALHLWCTAAERQGALGGSSIFEQFECIYPQHSWQAYESKWRRGLSQRPRPEIDTDTPFVNLVDSTSSREERDHGSTQAVNESQLTASPFGHRPSQEFVIVGVDEEEGEDVPPEDHLEPGSGSEVSPHDRTTYKDFRVDILSNILRLVGFEHEEGLADFMHHSWVEGPLTEFTSCYIDVAHARDVAYVSDRKKLPKEKKGFHRWKIARAVEAVQSLGSRYLEHTPDKTLWTDDDHEIRFIARVTKAATNMTGHAWAYSTPLSVSVLAERSFWLAAFVRWVYKPVVGRSANMQTLRRRKERWIALLSNTRVTHEHLSPLNLNVTDLALGVSVSGPQDEMNLSASSSASSPTPVTVCPSAGLGVDGSLDGMNELYGNGSAPPIPLPTQERAFGGSAESPTSQVAHLLHEVHCGTPTLPISTQGSVPILDQDIVEDRSTGLFCGRGKIVLPPYRPVQSKVKNQQRGVAWLTEEAYQTYKLYRDRKLTRWGVTADHQASCVLIPADWAESSPEEVIVGFRWDDPLDEGPGRLKIHIGDLGTSWARACAWFKVWPELPRRGADLDGLLVSTADDVYPEMHGSHLCHHGWCVNPNHLIYETGAENMSRVQCAKAATNIRLYKLGVPLHCNIHDPPCLMHQAALTTKESLAVQWSVFCTARGVEIGANDVPRPHDHPLQLTTFERGLPLSLGIGNAITLNQSHLAPTSLDVGTVLEKYKVRCPFCPGQQRSWRQITNYWSHVRSLHPEVAVLEKLSEIRRSSAEYERWIRSRGFDYQQNNPETWLKMQQTQAANFDWEVVKGWRLRFDRQYERYQALNDDGD